MSATPSDAERALGERVDAAGRHGESAKVLKLMRAHPTSAYVQLCGLFNLAQLVQGPPVIARAAERGGAAEAALSALRAFPADAGVAGNACCALGNIIVCSPAAREQLVAAGVAADIVAVLREHVGDAANAMPTSCHALAMLARLPEHARIVADLGAAQLTLAAMQAHPESAAVQCKGATLCVAPRLMPPLPMLRLTHAFRTHAGLGSWWAKRRWPLRLHWRRCRTCCARCGSRWSW
jgi:hypothetical protein